MTIPRVGAPVMVVMSYLWGYKRGGLRYKARKKLLDVHQVRDFDEATLRELIGESQSISLIEIQRSMNGPAVRLSPTISLASSLARKDTALTRPPPFLSPRCVCFHHHHPDPLSAVVVILGSQVTCPLG